MKKLLSLLILATLILPLISAADIAYIIKSRTDNNILNAITEKGYTLDVIRVANINSANISAYKAIVVGNEQFSASEAARIPVNTKNSVIINTYNLQDWYWITDGVASISPSQPKTLPVLDTRSSIVRGLGSSFTSYIYDGATPDIYKIYYLPNAKKAPGVNVVVADDTVFRIRTMRTEVKNGAVIASVRPGAQLKSGRTAQSRAVFFGITNTNLWSASTKTAFKNSLDFAINDGVVKLADIPDQTFPEDTNATINLSQYFRSTNNLSLTYTVESRANNNVNIIITGSTAKLVPNTNWFGTSWVIFNVTDGENTIKSNTIDIEVTSVNDAPVFTTAQADIYAIAGETININPAATDADGDTVTFTYSQKLNSTGDWQTHSGDEGVYPITITASDNHGGTAAQTFTIHILAEIKINEFVSNPVSGQNEWVELYNPTSRLVSLAGCELKDEINTKLNSGELTSINPNGFLVIEWTGSKLNNDGDIIKLICGNRTIDQITYPGQAPIPSQGQSSARQPDGTANFVSGVPTKGFPNNAFPPVVTLGLPENAHEFRTTNNINFTFQVTGERSPVICDLYTNTLGSFVAVSSTTLNLVSGSASGLFYLSGINNGIYNWSVKCNNGLSYAFSEMRTFTIAMPGPPIFNQIPAQTVNENETLSFIVSAVDPQSSPVTYSVETPLPTGTTFNNLTGNFTWRPDFNQAGRYTVTFIARNNANLSSSMPVQIRVTNVRQPPQFNDAIKCSEKDEDIIITIKEPDKGDDFEIGDIVPVSVKIKNNFEEDLEFDVEAHLYDISTDESVADIDDNIDIDSKDTETFEKELKVPRNAENSNDEYAIYVYVESEDNKCSSNFIEIDVERKKDDLSISKFEINPVMQSPGRLVDFFVKINNDGSRDQDDVYIKIENKELGLNLISDTFDIEKFDDDDTITKRFSFSIPKETKEGNYDIKASVFYSDDNEADSLTKQIGVTKSSVEVITKPEIKVIKTDGTIYLIQPTSQPTGRILLTAPAGTSQIQIIPTEIVQVQPENRLIITSSFSSVIDDPLVKVLIIIFDIVLLIGSIILFIRAIIYISKR